MFKKLAALARRTIASMNSRTISMTADRLRQAEDDRDRRINDELSRYADLFEQVRVRRTRLEAGVLGRTAQIDRLMRLQRTASTERMVIQLNELNDAAESDLHSLRDFERDMAARIRQLEDLRGEWTLRRHLALRLALNDINGREGIESLEARRHARHFQEFKPLGRNPTADDWYGDPFGWRYFQLFPLPPETRHMAMRTLVWCLPGLSSDMVRHILAGDADSFGPSHYEACVAACVRMAVQIDPHSRHWHAIQVALRHAVWTHANRRDEEAAWWDYNDLVGRVLVAMYPLAIDPLHVTSDAAGVARGIVKDGRHDTLPILADALQDGGVPDAICDQVRYAPAAPNNWAAIWVAQRG